MIRESIDTLLIHGKPLMAHRLGLAEALLREPHGQTSAFGHARLDALAAFLENSD